MICRSFSDSILTHAEVEDAAAHSAGTPSTPAKPGTDTAGTARHPSRTATADAAAAASVSAHADAPNRGQIGQSQFKADAGIRIILHAQEKSEHEKEVRPFPHNVI